MVKMPSQGLGSNSVRADASGDRIVSDATSRHRGARSWASKPAAATVIWKAPGGFRTAGEDGSWRISDAAFRRLRFRAWQLERKILTNRRHLNGEWQTVA